MSLIPESGRRGFLGMAAGAVMARPLTEKEKLARIASNTWPLRSLFKSRSTRPNPQAEEMKKKYGELTMLDMPRFTKETFPGVTKMDLFSGLFGDFSDESMFAKTPMTFNGQTRNMLEFDPSSEAGKKWLDQMAGVIAKSGIKCHHISNNAPRDLCELDEEKRRAGIEVAKKWLTGAAAIGAKTMRVNSGGPRIAPNASATRDYPRNDEIVKYLGNAIQSLKELADFGGKVGVKITLENHWGLTANPMNIRIILEEVNHPFCEATPDFCNWEHEYMLYHGLEALAPFTKTTVHAKFWNRWKEVDVKRCVRILEKAGYKGVYALEYEDGPWDGVEGSRYLFKEVMAAL